MAESVKPIIMPRFSSDRHPAVQVIGTGPGANMSQAYKTGNIEQLEIGPELKATSSQGASSNIARLCATMDCHYWVVDRWLLTDDDILNMDPLLWFSAADLVGVVADGAEVTQWADRTGNGYTATAEAGTAPVFMPHVQNGQPGLLFSSDTEMTMAEVESGPDRTVFTVGSDTAIHVSGEWSNLTDGILVPSSIPGVLAEKLIFERRLNWFEIQAVEYYLATKYHTLAFLSEYNMRKTLPAPRLLKAGQVRRVAFRDGYQIMTRATDQVVAGWEVSEDDILNLGPIAWLAVSDLAETATDGAEVLALADRTGNGYDATASTGTAPEYDADGMNGRPALVFASGDEMAIEPIILGGDYTIFTAGDEVVVSASVTWADLADGVLRANTVGGKISEWLIFPRQLSEAEYGSVERYLANKYWRVTDATIAGMAPDLWLSAFDLVGEVTDGSEILALADRSANSNDVTAVAGTAPVFDADGYNGKPTMVFEATDLLTLTSAIDLGSDYTIITTGDATAVSASSIWADLYAGKIETAPNSGKLSEIIIFKRVLTEREADFVSRYVAAKYWLTTDTPVSETGILNIRFERNAP